MTRVVCNVLASAFFGACAADLVEHVSIPAATQDAAIGVIGYLGAMTSDLLLSKFRR